jgi:uncharacterized protein (DUF1697 family)
MKNWIVLLRGINVGGKHIVPMKALRALLTTEGYLGVKTYIQSGNVLLQSSSHPAEAVGALMERHFGFKPAIFALEEKAFEQARALNPYPTAPGKSVHFFFLDREPPTVDQGLLAELKADSESFQLIGEVFYLHAPDGIGRSKLVAKIARAFPQSTLTARNLNTINKLSALLAS